MTAGQRPHSAARVYAIAALLGLAYAFWLYPPNFVLGDAGIYEHGDFAQHLSGWRFYRADDWHFPLLWTTRLNAPEGVSIAFTDSIPLAALLFKALSPWLPDDFQYFGLWHLGVFVLQAMAGVFLLRSLVGGRVAGGAGRGVSDLSDLTRAGGDWADYAVLAGAALALLSATLPGRIGHTALMTHGLVLLALGVYFRGIRRFWSGTRTTTALTLLLWLGLLIHPYWLALCFGLFLAWLIDNARCGSGWRPQVPRLVLALSGIALMLWLFGYMGSGLRAEGFGIYSMNLLAPFCGGRITPCFVDGTGYQYAGGDNYLGVGLLLLALVSVPLWLRTHPGWLVASARRYLGLLLCALAFSLYALSNKIYFGSQLLLDLSLPQWLAWASGIFRVSGRFFWPVGYLIGFIVLALALRQRHRRLVLTVLLIALPLQAWDVQPYWDKLHRQLAAPASGDLEPWRGLLASLERINLHPAFGCQEGDIEQYFFFQRLAAHYDLTLDTGYIARANVDCAAKAAKYHQPFQPGALYVLAAPYFSRNPDALPSGFRQALAAGECAQWQGALLCRPGTRLKDGSRLTLALQSTERYLPDGGFQWRADNLPTNIGQLAAGELRPRESDLHGHLSFGPYVALPPGRYQAQIGYRSDLPPSEVAGDWDAVAAPINGGRVRHYAQGTLTGTAGAEGVQRIELIIQDGDGPLEVRTLYPGTGDLRILWLRISRDIAKAVSRHSTGPHNKHDTQKNQRHPTQAH